MKTIKDTSTYNTYVFTICFLRANFRNIKNKKKCSKKINTIQKLRNKKKDN